ncbi:hypothetical protein ASE41_11160 [Streptomyces sp. Root264]|nr:hypothetical protein ASE41_11160 [Streptomyces sp. Root264]
MLAFTEWRASKVTTVSARSSGASRGLKWRTSLVFAPTSTWAIGGDAVVGDRREQVTAYPEGCQQRVRGPLAELGEFIDALRTADGAQAHISKIAVSEYHRPRRERGSGTDSR